MARTLSELWEAVWRQPPRPEGPPRLRPKPGRVEGDAQQTTAPIPLTQLVAVSRVDISARLRERIEAGHGDSTVGIGSNADIQLLDDDLLAADVTVVQDRRLVVATLCFRPGTGFSVERGHSNFGVFYDIGHGFSSVGRYRRVEDLRPGDRVGLGSCPGDALWFSLPDVRGVRFTPREARPVAGFDLLYQERFRVALLHWRYAEIPFGSDPESVICVSDPELDGMRAVLRREPDDPSQGYVLRVDRSPAPVSWCRGGTERFDELAPGAEARLHGIGNRIRFGSHQVELPAPAVPVGRFAGRDTPTVQDIVAILGIDPRDVHDAGVVKGRYRELIRVLHPDRTGGAEGPTSRFLEVQACWTAWQDQQ